MNVVPGYRVHAPSNASQASLGGMTMRAAAGVVARQGTKSSVLSSIGLPKSLASSSSSQRVLARHSQLFNVRFASTDGNSPADPTNKPGASPPLSTSFKDLADLFGDGNAPDATSKHVARSDIATASSQPKVEQAKAKASPSKPTVKKNTSSSPKTQSKRSENDSKSAFSQKVVSSSTKLESLPGVGASRSRPSTRGRAEESGTPRKPQQKAPRFQNFRDRVAGTPPDGTGNAQWDPAIWSSDRKDASSNDTPTQKSFRGRQSPGAAWRTPSNVRSAIPFFDAPANVGNRTDYVEERLPYPMHMTFQLLGERGVVLKGLEEQFCVRAIVDFDTEAEPDSSSAFARFRHVRCRGTEENVEKFKAQLAVLISEAQAKREETRKSPADGSESRRPSFSRGGGGGGRAGRFPSRSSAPPRAPRNREADEDGIPPEDESERGNIRGQAKEIRAMPDPEDDLPEAPLYSAWSESITQRVYSKLPDDPSLWTKEFVVQLAKEIGDLSDERVLAALRMKKALLCHPDQMNRLKEADELTKAVADAHLETKMTEAQYKASLPAEFTDFVGEHAYVLVPWETTDREVTEILRKPAPQPKDPFVVTKEDFSDGNF